jgi:hypothetical protein
MHVEACSIDRGNNLLLCSAATHLLLVPQTTVTIPSTAVATHHHFCHACHFTYLCVHTCEKRTPAALTATRHSCRFSHPLTLAARTGLPGHLPPVVHGRTCQVGCHHVQLWSSRPGQRHQLAERVPEPVGQHHTATRGHRREDFVRFSYH